MPNTDPNALDNLPALDRFTDAALLADYAAQVTLDHEAQLLDQSPTTQAMADEILRRMAR